MDNEALEQVIAKAGGPSALAKKLGVTSQAVSQWKSVPARHAAIVADILDCPVRTLLSARRTPTEAHPVNETRRIALEFAMRCQPINGFGLIRLALQIEAFLTNDNKALLELFGGNDPGVAEVQEARP